MSTKGRYILSRIGGGYSRVFLSAVRFFVFLAFIAAVSFLITFPLWFWALNATESFTLFVIVLLAGATVFFLYRKGLDFITRKRREGLSYLRIVRIPLLKAGRILLLILFIYIFATLIAHSQFAAAVIVSLAALLLFGFLFFAR